MIILTDLANLYEKHLLLSNGALFVLFPGGCGAMYQISIEAEEFRGKRTVAQHRLVNEVIMIIVVKIVIMIIMLLIIFTPCLIFTSK